MLFRSFWIVFLFIPLVFLIRTDMPAPLKALGLLGLGAFACVYIWAVSTMAIWLELPDGAGILDQLRPVASRIALLTGTAAASAPGLNWWYALTYLPYFCAIVLFATRLRTGLIVSGCLTARVFCQRKLLKNRIQNRFNAIKNAHSGVF